MKFDRFIVVCLCVCVLISAFISCTKQDMINSEDIKDETIIKNDAQDSGEEKELSNDEKSSLNETTYVSHFATEDFLEPFDDFSWEREYPVEKIVLHFTSAVVLSKDDPYNMDTIRSIFEDNSLSINYIIDRNGNITCFLPESRCAWHAGAGTFADDEKYTNTMNKYSIGIEIVAIGSENDMKQYLTPQEYSSLSSSLIGFTDEQYTALSELISDICSRYNIPCDREHIIGHSEYNPNKSDPGELFDWSRIIK